MKKRKLTALFLAAAMGLSAPAGAQAVSYQEAEKAALSSALESFITIYSQQLSAYKETIADPSLAEMSLELHDGGKALLGMMVPTDISWLNDLHITGNVGFGDTQLAEILDVHLNGTKICTMEVYMDSETMDTYVRIPEMADGYLKTTMEEMEASQAALEDSVNGEEYGLEGTEILSASPNAQAFLSDYMKALPHLADYLPQSEDLSAVLDRYGSILIDHTQETTKGTDTLTVSDISQDCTTLEAVLTQAEASAAVKETLATAKEDQELKTMIQGLEELSPDSGISYEGFLSKVGSLLTDVPQETSDEPLVSSKIWVDPEDNIIGRQLSLIKEGEETPMTAWKSPSSGEDSGFYFQLNSGEDTFEILGTGKTQNSKLDGSYELIYNGQAVASAEVSGYDVSAMENGVLNGTYTFSLLPGIGEDAYKALSFMGLTASFSGDNRDSSGSLTLTSSGAPALTYSVNAKTGAGSVEYLDFDSLDKVYDASTEEGVAAFNQDMNTEVIKKNLTDAGMPDTFLEDLMSAGQEEAYYDEETSLDSGVDEGESIEE